MLNGRLFSSSYRTEHDITQTNKQTNNDYSTFLTVHILPIQAHHRRSYHLVDGPSVFSSFRFQTLFFKSYDSMYVCL